MKEGVPFRPDGLYVSPRQFESRDEIMNKIAQETTMTVFHTLPNEPISFEQHWGKLLELQHIKNETLFWRDEIDVTVNTGEFPFFMFRPLSDTHIGAAGVDYKQLGDHLEDIKKYPIYTAICGDLGDMFSPTKHPEGMMGDLMNPQEQLSMMRKFFEEYKEKIITTVQDPSHTDWVRQAAGIEPQQYITENLQIPALKSGGIVHLKVNDIEYRLLLFHEIGKYKSSLNVTNAGKRMLDMRADADLVVSGHTHIGAMEKGVKREGKPYIVQLGTFKLADEFGERKGLVPRPQVFFPTIFFDGRRKNIEVMEDRGSAMEFVKTFAELNKLKHI